MLKISTSWKYTATIIQGLMILTLFLAACSSQNTPDPVSLTIDMKEFAFEPANVELQVGQVVTLDLVNLGSLEHEIMFGRDVMEMDGRPSGFEHDLFEEANIKPMIMMAAAENDHAEAESGMRHGGFMVSVPAGYADTSMTFTVTEAMMGEWEIGCFLQDGVHYQAGMLGTLTVTK